MLLRRSCGDPFLGGRTFPNGCAFPSDLLVGGLGQAELGQQLLGSPLGPAAVEMEQAGALRRQLAQETGISDEEFKTLY